MKASWLSYGFLVTFLVVLFALQWFEHTHYPPELWMTLLAVACTATALVVFKKSRPFGCIVLAITVGTSAALYSVQRTAHAASPNDIESFADERKYTIMGTIADAPDRRQMQTKLTIRAHTLVSPDGQRQEVHGQILATDRSGWPVLSYGDEVEVKGTLLKPGMIETFDYAAYLSLRDISAYMPRATVRRTAAFHERSSPRTLAERLLWNIYATRDVFESRIARMQPEPHASLLTGLLTGSRGGMPQRLLDDFRVSGLSHVVAISGYNITMIITLVGGLLFWLPLQWRFLPLTLGVALFTIFVGASASVVRAAIMGILGLFALQTGRKNSIRLTILWTAFFMAALNPKQLWFDAGFQLSFLAVIGMAELSKPVGRLLRWAPETLAIRESLTATMAAQIATLPLIAALFKQVSFIAPLSNLLIAPLIPLAMLLGFVGTVAGWLWRPLGLLPSYAAWGFLQLIITIAHFAASVPYAAVSWGAP